MNYINRHYSKLMASFFILIGAASLSYARADITIDAVFFAQTHVQEPSYEYFTLVSDREALIKVHVLSSDPSRKLPNVEAIVSVNGDKHKVSLSGPASLPAYIEKEACFVDHHADDSFIGYIPKEWVQPGMSVKIKAGKKRTVIENFKVGAPTVLNINMFDIFTFKEGDKDYPSGWKQEFEAKLPVSRLEVERVNAVFGEIVVAPSNSGPAKRVYSKNETRKGEKMASRWMGALMDAAGTARRTNLYYLNTHNLSVSAGRGADFHAVGQVGQEGYLLHEGGHALSLAHSSQGFHPYKKSMCGVYAEKPHVGPTWFFDLPNKKFTSPISNLKGSYKKSPMLGGGRGNEKEYWAKTYMKNYSDFGVNKMQKYLEKHMVVWNQDLNSYANWNSETNDYTKTVANNGVLYPVERDVDVVSILSSVSAVTEEANIIYPPIGPYKAGLIELFDPSIAGDRVAAEKVFCPSEGCDVSLRIIQGGQKKYVMLPISWDESADPLAGSSFLTKAVNLPASEGEVSNVKVLFTPDAEHNGLPNTMKAIAKWRK